MMIEMLYGRRPVHEVLRAGRRRIYQITLAAGLKTGGIVGQIVALAQAAGLPVRQVPRSQLDRVAPHHQGVIAEVSPYPYAGFREILARAAGRPTPPLLLLLDLLQDPQNVGSLLRTAEAVGVHGVVLPKRRAVGVTPAVVSASAGAVEHLQVARVTNLARAIETLQDHDIWVAGLEADPQAQLCFEADLRGPLALVVGSEGKGLRRLVRAKCDFLLRLPMRGQVASLNAAVAGSVALYEVWRQRGP